MKASELMIGDWVYYSHTEDGIAPYKEVICIKAEDLCCDACIIETHYEPIPLTLEILEKNGFEREGSWFIIEDDYYDVSIKEITDSIWRVKYCNTEFSAFDCVMHVAFVHELQHALRLCGITLNIEV